LLEIGESIHKTVIGFEIVDGNGVFLQNFVGIDANYCRAFPWGSAAVQRTKVGEKRGVAVGVLGRWSMRREVR